MLHFVPDMRSQDDRRCTPPSHREGARLRASTNCVETQRAQRQHSAGRAIVWRHLDPARHGHDGPCGAGDAGAADLALRMQSEAVVGAGWALLTAEQQGLRGSAVRSRIVLARVCREVPYTCDPRLWLGRRVERLGAVRRALEATAASRVGGDRGLLSRLADREAKPSDEQ
jgi:hypothetical protein